MFLSDKRVENLSAYLQKIRTGAWTPRRILQGKSVHTVGGINRELITPVL